MDRVAVFTGAGGWRMGGECWLRDGYGGFHYFSLEELFVGLLISGRFQVRVT